MRRLYRRSGEMSIFWTSARALTARRTTPTTRLGAPWHVACCPSVVLWLEAAADPASVGDVVTRIAALTQLAGDIDVRLARAGLGGLEGIAALYERLRTALGDVTADDLARMAEEVARLQAALAATDRQLAALRELKALLDRAERAG